MTSFLRWLGFSFVKVKKKVSFIFFLKANKQRPPPFCGGIDLIQELNFRLFPGMLPSYPSLIYIYRFLILPCPRYDHQSSDLERERIVSQFKIYIHIFVNYYTEKKTAYLEQDCEVFSWNVNQREIMKHHF